MKISTIDKSPFLLSKKSALKIQVKSEYLIKTTSKPMVCTAPIRGYYRLSLSKRH